MKEVWKQLSGFEGYYEISNLGKIRSLDRTIILKNGNKRKLKGKEVKQTKYKSGYLYIKISCNGKNLHARVHRLVALHFVNGRTKEKNQVNHINENKLDNRAENLEWCTNTYNNNYGTVIERRSKSQSKPVVAKNETGEIIYKYDSQSKAAKALNLSQGDISFSCRTGNKYKGLYWNFIK